MSQVKPNLRPTRVTAAGEIMVDVATFVEIWHIINSTVMKYNKLT